MDQFLREFLSEADDQLEVLAVDVGELRNRRDDGRSRREILARIFRHTHSLKGSSAGVELNKVTDLAHAFESLLDSIRLGRTTLDDDALHAFDETVVELSQLLHAASTGQTLPSTSSLIDRLRLMSKETNGPQRDSLAIPDEIGAILTDVERQRLNESLGEGSRLFSLEVSFDIVSFDTGFKELSDKLRTSGEIIASQPGVASHQADQITFHVVYASNESASAVERSLKEFGRYTLKEYAGNGDDDSVNEVTFGGLDDPSNALPVTNTVRVNSDDLDEAIESVRQLHSESTETLDLALSSFPPDQVIASDLKSRMAAIRSRFEQLESRLHSMRTIPAQRFLDRAVRAGVVAARKAGKEIEFEIKGGDVLLERSVSDVIADPILHLLRNAVDHGIESPAERTSQGKTMRGSILLEAIADAEALRVKISDDGRGIDPHRVSLAAQASGLIENGNVLSKEESFRIIFARGFSTSENANALSGRGVGLEVVERAIEKLGGKIEVDSTINAGTTFELTFRR